MSYYFSVEKFVDEKWRNLEHLVKVLTGDIVLMI